MAKTAKHEKTTADEWQLRAQAELFHLHFTRWRIAIDAMALDLLRLTQKAIANALKHGAATELTLTVRHSDNAIEIVVHDNGCGFDPSTVSLGCGLRNQSQRAERLGGKLKIESAPGSGTMLHLHLPMNREPKA